MPRKGLYDASDDVILVEAEVRAACLTLADIILLSTPTLSRALLCGTSISDPKHCIQAKLDHSHQTTVVRESPVILKLAANSDSSPSKVHGLLCLLALTMATKIL